MKTGVIVYVLGNDTHYDEFDEKQAISGLSLGADRVSFVFSGDNEDDFAYLWWEMVSKGMSHIMCMIGELTSPSTIRLTGRQLQLAGY